MAQASAAKNERQEETRHLDMATQPVKRLRTMLAAGEEVIEIQRVLGRTGDSVVSELLRGHETFYEWDHYPKGRCLRPPEPLPVLLSRPSRRL